MKKYGLQLRVQPQQKKQNATRPPRPSPLGFNDDDEDDVEKEISRQASKNKAIKEIEEQHKKALAEDPSVFDYDGVYDDMKQAEVRPRVQDREQRKPKYIPGLLKKSIERGREQEIVYERKLAKERSKEDHLYADKDKFVTSAYKKKLAEQAKWMEEERLRQLKEEKDDVTKKSDMTDFYFNLSKNVAFGSEGANPTNLKRQVKEVAIDTAKGTAVNVDPVRERHEAEASTTSLKERSVSVPIDGKPGAAVPSAVQNKTAPEEPPTIEGKLTANHPAARGDTSAEQTTADQPKRDHYKRHEDQVAAAKERFLARKRAKEQ